MKKLLCVIGVVMAFTMTNNIKAAGPQRTTARWSDNSYLYQDVLYALGLSVSAFTTATATVSGDLSVGSMSCPGDLGITASNLTVNLRAAASTDLGRFAVRSLEAVADRSDSDYAEWALLEAYDSQTNWQTFARFKIISSDITSADEDCTIQLWYDIAGTPTLGAVWDSGGLTVKGLKNEGLTVSKPVFTDAASKLTSAGILGADQGGTGTNTLTDHGLMLGSAAGIVTVLAEATDGQIPIGDTGEDPVLATITGTAEEVTVANSAGTITLGIDDPLIVAKGGSGAATLAEHGVMIGSGTGVVSVTGVGAAGQLLIGQTTADPSYQTMGGEATIGATGTVDVDLDAHGLDVTELPAAITGQMLVGNTADSNFTVVAMSGVTVDAAGAATVAATAITGNLSTNQGGAGTLSGILKATAGVVAPAVADTDYVQVSSVYGSATSVNGALASAQVICTNTITMLDVAGSTFADYTLVHVWMSETSKGTASTNNIETLVLTGTEVVETTAASDYQQVTPANGIMTATITATANGTNYINVGVGPRVTSTEIVFLP